MPKLEEEKHMIKRTILFILIFLMNEVMIYFMGTKEVLTIKISQIGYWIRIMIAIVFVLSIIHYIKEKAFEINVEEK